MEVTLKFKIRDKDCSGNDISNKEQLRIIKSVERNLINQWNVSEITIPKIK